ncbi:1-hydroxycarotenoid 3,4-desaturase CrtD [Flavobacteriaceae bacterium 14752]|uniref:1-hydroxycarotenoid 3,4-desaturase CrtD n=1 Tax=Mesohalobacter salilacus TaxID=2491711 RepID=UPI000F63A314|nr:phytoene desaturase [Flavobacteriaceae bacterium 14752]
MSKAIVIGAGIAGLASALRLKHQGYSVEVFEKNNYTGGKIHAIQLGNYRFDLGPSLFTLPHLVDELFELFEKNPTAYFNYIKKENICNYFWEDGSSFAVNADQNKFIQEASLFFNEPEEQLKKYLNKSQKKYDLTSPVFLEQSLHKSESYLNLKTLKAFSKAYQLDLNQSLDQVNQNYFSNEKLIQFFNRFATYNGSSPYKTPGIMSMIPHLEMQLGTYLPKKGMHDISQSLTRLAKDVEIKFHLNSPVDDLMTENGKIKAIRSCDTTYKADVVVCNMDVYTAYKSILKDAPKPKKTLNQERSSSALIFYWGINKTFPNLDLHNILFTEDYKEEFNHLFEKKYFYQDPTIYINITSKHIDKDAPEGCENWFVMVNAPTNEGQNWQEQTTYIREKIINKINRCLNTQIEQHIEVEKVITPKDIEKETASFQGSLYGTSSNNKYAAFLRHSNFSKYYKNLYFCGGSVHPGGGIPLCLNSAKIVSQLTSRHL